MSEPTFVIAGGQRCGTTWLAHLLDARCRLGGGGRLGRGGPGLPCLGLRSGCRLRGDRLGGRGLDDRGVLAPGYRADVNVIDFDRLRVHQPELLYDLPAGGRRVVQRADGYAHTFVAGVETYAEGVATGELPGRLVRGAQPQPKGA